MRRIMLLSLVLSSCGADGPRVIGSGGASSAAGSNSGGIVASASSNGAGGAPAAGGTVANSGGLPTIGGGPASGGATVASSGGGVSAGGASSGGSSGEWRCLDESGMCNCLVYDPVPGNLLKACPSSYDCCAMFPAASNACECASPDSKGVSCATLRAVAGVTPVNHCP